MMMKMMGAKLWAAIYALLLINVGSAKHDDSHAAASNSSETGGSEVSPEALMLPSSLEPTNHVVTSPSPTGSNANLSSTVTSSLSKGTSTEGHVVSLTGDPKKDNDTNIISPTVATGLESNLTDQLISQPPTTPPETHTPTPHTSLTSTTPSLLVTDHTAHVDNTPPTTQPANTSGESITSSNHSAPPKTQSSTSVPTSKPPELKSTTTNTTTINQFNTTANASSSPQPTKSSVSPTVTSAQNTLQPEGHPETSSEAHQRPTTLGPSSPSAQAKAHADTPSQLNVGGDTTMQHESPTLDPLLAGLVSAFIITAVIITLLLFLKLRRRDNRPEFRRLQDLPMDDMMEDTPLSMYSY